ncbi:IgA-binding beta antigen [Streptococcus pneumoniae]|nr:IgA-binding beta antigen [Streptococcus pneumoniae]
MSKSNHERRMRYSIRKFSVGVASVAVASLFMGSVVHATENVSANPPIPQIVSPGDKKEYEDAVQRVNKEISDYVTSRLDSLDRSVSGFSEIVTKVQVVVDKYRDKIDRVSTKSMVEELGREVKKKVDEEIKLFQNRSGSKSTPKGLSLNDGLQGGGDPSVGQGPGVVPQPGGQAGGSMVVPPVTQTPQDTDKINTAKAKVETAKSKVKTLEKIKSDSGRAQAGDQKPSMPAPDTKPDLQPQPEVPSTSPEPKPIPQPDGKQPSTPKEPENKKPSVPTQEKPIPQPEKPKPEVKPQPETPKTSKIITASDGKTKVTVVFDKAVDADKVNIKEVTTKELAEKIARQTGGGTVRIFDLSLSKGGKETHVNGERTVRLALGQTASDVHVYHVKENGDLERIPSKVENGQVVFKTNHFSLFAIKTLSKNQNVTTPKQIKPSVQHGQTQIGENQTGKFQNKEVNHKPLATGNETMAKENPTSATEKNLPSTGAATNLVLEIIGLLGLAGTSLIAMKRRK